MRLVSSATARPSDTTGEFCQIAGSWLTRSGGAAAVPGDTSVRSSVSTEIPDSVYGTPSPRHSPPLSTR